jgi:transposase
MLYYNFLEKIMPKAYSKNLSVRVVDSVMKNKESQQEIASNFGIGVATFRRWIQLYKKNWITCL